MTTYPAEVEEALERHVKLTWTPPRITVRCTLEKYICDWGGDSTICCISCPRFRNCSHACRYAEDWAIRLVPCPFHEVEEE